MKDGTFIRRLALTGIVAAVYAVMSLFLPFLSYGQIQCRFSEILNLLVFINPVFAPGVILGCFITNIFSPFLLDMLFGTLATAAAAFCITRTKSLLAASLWPTVFMVIIGAEIMMYTPDIPNGLFAFITITLTVMAGEFVAVTIIGVPLFMYLMKNERLMAYLRGL